MRVEVAPGVGLEVEVRGEGAGVLLVHGLGGAKEDFAEQLELLGTRGFRVVAPDLRGHGASDHPPGSDAYGVEVFAADLDALAREVLPDGFHLVGHSVGGMGAQRWALTDRAPTAGRRLLSLTLVDTAHGPLPGLEVGLAEAAAWVAREQGMAELRRHMSERGSGSTPAHERLVRERPGYETYNERKWEALSADMYAALVVEIATRSERLGELAGLHLPTLVVVGAQDEPLRADAERMAAASVGSRLVVIEDAGHAPQLEAPERFGEALLSFFSAAGSGTA